MTADVLAPADELQIRNLIARYAYAIDGGEKEAFASLFLEDGAWNRENPPPATQDGSGPPQAVRGRAGLMDLIETATIPRWQLKARHQMTDVLVEPGPDGESAQVRYRALVTDWREGPGRVAMSVNYTASCVRTADGWKFATVSAWVLSE
jgi:SnoaL-like domain